MVSIPPELHDTQCDVCLYIYIMFVNGLAFLTTISKKSKYCTAIWVANHMAPTIANLVESVLKLYHQAGFQVTEACADHEFKPVLHILQDSGWSFMINLANAQEHVPEADHNNCSSRAYLHHLAWIPYKMLPQTTICYMVMETAAKLKVSA